MPSIVSMKLVDPEEYQSCIGDSEDLKCIVTTPGDYRADLTLIDLHNVKLQRGSVSLPRIVSSAHTNDLCNFCFPTAPQPAALFNGVEVPESSIGFYAPGAEYFVRSSGECFWGGISMPAETLASAAHVLVGHEITAPGFTRMICPPPNAMSRLRKLHRAAGLLATEAPEVLAHPEAARGLEQALIQAMVACLDTSGNCQETTGQRRHVAIMRRFQTVLESDPGRPLYVLEVAKAIGVSVRTLSICCQELLGMGPKHYLTLRRLNLARQALYIADPRETTVTDVATQFGFWQFGRFAGEYKFRFGELPSVTLRRRRGTANGL
jgi:AraC-like DNA-binding protein